MTVTLPGFDYTACPAPTAWAAVAVGGSGSPSCCCTVSPRPT